MARSSGSSLARALLLVGVSAPAALAMALPLPLPEDANIPPEYEYLGCYTDSPAARVLDQFLVFNELTPGLCAEHCPDAVYVGLEYGMS